MLTDLKYAIRQLGKSPGFTAVVVLTLAVAIGATTVLFSLVKGAYLDALPYPHPRKIVTLSPEFSQSGKMPFSGPEFLALRKRAQSLQNISALVGGSFNLSGEGDAVRFRGLRATASLFPMLETRPLLGRVFTQEEESPGKDRVVVISYALWQWTLGGQADVLGRQLRLNDVAYTIIGVMPPRFRYGDNDLWMPLALDLAHQDRATRNLYVHARLAPGQTVASADAELGVTARRLRDELGDAAPEYEDWRIHAAPLIDEVVRDVKSAFEILLGAVGCVLLIACSNISNLHLARNVLREPEIALRLALGARRSDLVRQLFLEALLPVVVGGGAGILLAVWSTGPLLRLIPFSYIPIEAEVHLDGSVLLATFGVTLLTALLVGLLPAWKASGLRLSDSLKGSRGTAGSPSKNRRTQRLLVISQVALTLVTLISCALMLKSFARVQAIEPGFDPAALYKFETVLPAARYTNAQQIQQFYERLLARVRAISGVQSASAVNVPPLAEFPDRAPFSIAGHPSDSLGHLPLAEQREVLPGYLSTLGIPLLHGRDFDERDTASAPPVALINETLARKYFRAREPIGERIRLQENGQESRWLTIVGVTKDVRQLRLTDPILPEIYRPHAQVAQPSRRMAFVVRSSLSLTTLLEAARTSIRAQDAGIPIFEAAPMQEFIARSFGGQKLATSLLGLFGIVALVLTVLGIYGVTAYFVARRTREIGICMALGAQRSAVQWMFLREGFAMFAIGLIVGLLLAFGSGRIVSSILFQVSARDPIAYAIAPVILAIAALLATWLPTRRALRVNPIEALRTE